MEGYVSIEWLKQTAETQQAYVNRISETAREKPGGAGLDVDRVREYVQFQIDGQDPISFNETEREILRALVFDSAHLSFGTKRPSIVSQKKNRSTTRQRPVPDEVPPPLQSGNPDSIGRADNDPVRVSPTSPVPPTDLSPPESPVPPVPPRDEQDHTNSGPMSPEIPSRETSRVEPSIPRPIWSEEDEPPAPPTTPDMEKAATGLLGPAEFIVRPLEGWGGVSGGPSNGHTDHPDPFRHVVQIENFTDAELARFFVHLGKNERRSVIERLDKVKVIAERVQNVAVAVELTLLDREVRQTDRRKARPTSPTPDEQTTGIDWVR